MKHAPAPPEKQNSHGVGEFLVLLALPPCFVRSSFVESPQCIENWWIFAVLLRWPVKGWIFEIFSEKKLKETQVLTSTSGFHRIWGVWNLETQLLFLLLNRLLKWDSFIFWIPTSNSAIADCGAQPRVAHGLWFAISKEDPVAEASGCELALGTVKKKTDVPNLCNKALKWKNMQQDDKMPLKRCLFILP